MSVTKDELSAYLDGSLDPDTAARIEAEAANNPDLARQLASSQQRPAAASDDSKGLQRRPAQVLDFNAARTRRNKEAKAEEKARKKRTRQPIFARPGLAVALCACAIGGVLLGTNIYGPPEISLHDGEMLAGTQLTQALETQLSGAVPSRVDGTPYRILTSFRREGGDFCRLFASAHLAGIACKEEPGWVLRQTLSTEHTLPDDLASNSPEGEILATAARRMALGDALDQPQEQAARAKGWHS